MKVYHKTTNLDYCTVFIPRTKTLKSEIRFPRDNENRLNTRIDPRSEYEKRLAKAKADVAVCEGKHIYFGNLRLAVAVVAVALGYACFQSLAPISSLIIPVVLFIGLMVGHSFVVTASERAARIRTHYESALARMDDAWHGRGETGERFLDPNHPYARDLDLFGPDSLFQLMNLARTRMGEETLACWLCRPATPTTIVARQQAILELSSRLDLREDLAVLGEEARSGVHPDRLKRWSKDPVVLRGGWQQLLAVLFALLNIGGVIYWFLSGQIWWLGASLGLTFSLGFLLRQHINAILISAQGAAGDLQLLAAVLARVEKESFSASYLVNLKSSLESDGEPPSVVVRKLARLAQCIDSLRSPAVQPLNILLLLAIHFSFGVEAWRRTHGHLVPKWLDAVGELEAALSLAAYCFEHPDDPFPEIIDGKATVYLEAEGLGHPLLPAKTMVRNDVTFSQSEPFIIISGSNMSGKSTFLRTTGINSVLALAGGPVRAKRFKITPLQVGASIQTLDSLAEGRSRFYTEILRLKQIVELTKGGLPVFFLLDELLAGTNSHDRRIGAAGILVGLLDNGAIGLVTTHDLSLTQMDDSRIRNRHFEDHLQNGILQFDYQMRSGVVAKSNALELMRAVGLDV